MTADLGPAATPRPVPSPEDRMRDARTDREYADRIPAPRPLTTDRTNGHHRDLHQHNAGLEADLRSQNRAVRELLADLTDAGNTIDAAQAALHRAGITDPAAEVGDLIGELAAQRDEALDARDVLRARLDEATEDRDLLRAENANLTVGLRRLRKQLDDMTATAAGFANERDEARAELTEERRERTESEAWGRQLRTELTKAQNERNAALRTIGAIRNAAEPYRDVNTLGTLAQASRVPRQILDVLDEADLAPSSVPPRRAQEDEPDPWAELDKAMQPVLAQALGCPAGPAQEPSTPGQDVALIERAAAVIVAAQKQPHTAPYHWAGALFDAGLLAGSPADRAQEEPACTCYPSGFSPGTYEGPMRDCPVHGEMSAEARP